MVRTIASFEEPAFRNAVQNIWMVAQAAEGYQIPQLMDGTEVYANKWDVEWHCSQAVPSLAEISCYSVRDAIVSGNGQIWIEDQLIADPRVMPRYVANVLKLDNGGSDELRANRNRPVRIIKGPCLVAIGHGTHVYGHFLIEVLFRILVAKSAMKMGLPQHKILIEQPSPPWLLHFLTCYLGIRFEDIEFLRPGFECVQLEQAIIPTRVCQDSGFHPVANTILADLLRQFPESDQRQFPQRVFVARNRYVNPLAPHRVCLNEAKLAEIAEHRYGFTPVTIETLDWPDQIRLFRAAEIIVGQAGSGLHNALFSSPGSKQGSIGFMNEVQSEIAALRCQHLAFMTKGFTLQGEFNVAEDLFHDFLNKVCS